MLPFRTYKHIVPFRYDHPNILAGAGTMGLEIMEQVKKVDAVIVPVGGGGLIAGVAVAIKTLSPSTLVIVSPVQSLDLSKRKKNTTIKQLHSVFPHEMTITDHPLAAAK